MALLRLIGFSGEVPRLQPRMLPDTGAQTALNVRLQDGSLTPMRYSRVVRRFAEAASGTLQTIYQHQGQWLAWTKDVDAAQGPVAQDRLYYTGDGAPKMRVDNVVYDLAVPRPTAALVGAPTGTQTSSDLQTRLYAYTFVTAFGEESEPSDPSNEIEWRPGQNVSLAGFQAAPPKRNITKQRIYRSQTSATGASTFYLIEERDVATDVYLDQHDVSDFAEALPSTDWNAPPDDLQGLISLPNGMMAAFSGKSLYFCEPWYPHAWPEKYVLTTDYPIVALGAFGTSIAVLTTGNPYVVGGVAPEQMAQEKLELNLPCVNAKGVVDLGYSIAYPSNTGLVAISSNGAQIVSQGLITAENWRRMNPTTFVAAQKDGRYFASYEYLDDENVGRKGSFLFDMSGSTPFIIRTTEFANAVFYDIPSSILYMLKDTEVHEFDATGQQRMEMVWRSKQFLMQPLQESLACLYAQSVKVRTDAQMKAIAATRAAAIAENATKLADPLGGEIAGVAFGVYAINGDGLAVIPQEELATIKLFCDGELVATTLGLNAIKRLPAGYRGQVIEVEISGTAEIAEVRLATSIEELAGGQQPG